MIDRTCPQCMSGAECGHAYEHIPTSEKIACAKCGSIEFEITDGMERGAKMERQQRAAMILAAARKVLRACAADVRTTGSHSQQWLAEGWERMDDDHLSRIIAKKEEKP